MINSTMPMANNTWKWVLPCATSPISAAMVAVMVRTGINSELMSSAMRAALPVTINTAIVSPMARPTPSIIAVRMPDLPAFTVTIQMVCHLVAPSASAASR